MATIEGSGEDDEESLIGLVSASYASKEVTNVIVLTLTVSVMVIYVVTYIVVAVLERRRLAQGCLHMPVGDVLDKDHYYYVVTVATGLCGRSGLNPSGQVQITLRGSAANSRPLVIRNLDCSGATMVLKRGGIDYFLLPVPRSLGEVQKVDIDLYSPKYDSISWYVKYIRVTDIRYGTHSDFSFDRWLSTCDHLRMGVQQSKMSACRIFGERFLSIFLDLHVWTSTWTRSSELGVFRRSVRISFCMMTLACLMLANLLVCFILAISKSGLILVDQVSLIKEALIFGVAANVVVMIVQYLFELLLRRVRTSSDHHLTIRGRNIWKKKPLPLSMYPVIDDSYCDTDASEAPTDPLLNTVAEYKIPHRLSNGKPSGKSNGKKSKSLKSSKHWKEEKGTESWMPEFNSLPSVMEDENEDVVDGYADGSGYVADDEFGNHNKEIYSKVLIMDIDMTDTACDYCSHSSNNYNLNANKVISETDNKETFTNLIKHILWNETDGIVAKYIMMHEKGSEEKLKLAKDKTTKVGNEEFASYLVSLVLEGAKKEVISGEGSCMGNIQDEVLKKLQTDFMKAPDFMDQLSQGRIQVQDDLKVHSHSSEGQLGGEVCKKGTDQSLSVTSSCPEVQSPKPSKADVDNYGPVATRLSESITAIAYRNSFTSLQKNATDKLVSQSKDRIASFTTLVQETNLTDQNLMIPSSSSSPELFTGIPQRTDKMNVKTLLDFISPNRAERLTEKSMKYIAKASLSSLVCQESLQKLRDTAADFNQKSLQAFTFDIVNNLYTLVRGKLEDIIEAHLASQSPVDRSRSEQIADFLAASDEEIKTSVLPLLEDYIQSLITDQARSFEDVDVELVMMAFSGQYVDTIITNAVLQTHVGLLKAKKSVEGLHAKQKSTDSNINNNTEDAIKTALVQLQQTPESQKIVDLLCECMLNSYKNKKGCTVDHPKHINEAMKNTFRRSASACEAFERVLAEADSYLKLLSEYCDMKRVQENSSLMAKLSDTFLTSGLDIETHSVLTEELSSNLLDKALEHACVVVAEGLIVPYLQPSTPIFVPNEDNQPEQRDIPKEITTFDASRERKSPIESSTNTPTSQGDEQTIGASPVALQLTKLATPGPETETDDWKTASAGSPKVENDTLTGSPVQRSGSVGRDGFRRTLSDRKKSPKSKRSLGDKLNEKRSPLRNMRHDTTEDPDSSGTYSPNMLPVQSPMRSSTPRLDGDQFKDSRDSSVCEKWSPMQTVDEVDFGGYRQPSDSPYSFIPIDTQSVWPSGKIPRGTSSDTESSLTNALSVPLMPKDCQSMLSYDDNISQVGNAGLMYIPCKSNIEAGENTLAEREKLWQLDLERDIHGESTKCLPTFVMHILQVLIVVVTVAALSLCILFGLRLPNSSAVAWLVALVVGILQHVLVWETLKVTAVALYYVTCYDADI